jgi:RimJ/RimL family protein N-acetyltransferase
LEDNRTFAMGALSYRPAEDSDVPALARLQAARWETEEYWKVRIPAYLHGELDPRQALKPRVGYVALEDDSIVGLIAGHLTRRYDCDGELEWIIIAPEHRGAGVAAELLRLLAAWFVAQNALRICVDVDPKNAGARSFYAKFGAKELNPHWLVWKDIRVVLARS